MTDAAPRGSSVARVLVAGIGNVLRGDDGFGPAVITALRARGAWPDGLHAVELGIGGIGLVHELMDGYDALVIVDAIDRSGAPGTIYTVEPDVPQVDALSALERQTFGDMHETVPARALVLARAAGVLPAAVRIIGCQPAETDELTTTLSGPVAAAVEPTVERVFEFVASVQGTSASDDLERRDEILQLLFWLHGELGPDVALDDVVRFADDAAAARRALDQLVTDGYVERRTTERGERYRLTPFGQTEGRRRFLDEFEPYLARGHGECGIADCDCHRGGVCRNS